MRTAANNNLSNGTSLGLNSFTAPSFFYINPDPVIGITTDNPVQLAPAAQVGTSRNNTPADPVNLTNAGIGALTNAILTNQDAWSLADGTGGNPATQATDNAPTQYSNAYLTSTDASSGGNALTLNGTEGTNYTWLTATVRANANTTVLGLDGTTGYGSANDALINTQGSYSISAWVDPAAATSGTQVIAAECGNNHCALYFGLTSGGYWQIGGQGSDTSTDTTYYGATDTAALAANNTWTHLVATFNAVTDTYSLYVNGALAATAAGRPTGWAATGPFAVGALDLLGNGTPIINNYFRGQVSDIQAYNYALTAPQITALYDQIQ